MVDSTANSTTLGTSGFTFIFGTIPVALLGGLNLSFGIGLTLELFLLNREDNLLTPPSWPRSPSGAVRSPAI